MHSPFDRHGHASDTLNDSSDDDNTPQENHVDQLFGSNSGLPQFLNIQQHKQSQNNLGYQDDFSFLDSTSNNNLDNAIKHENTTLSSIEIAHNATMPSLKISEEARGKRLRITNAATKHALKNIRKRHQTLENETKLHEFKGGNYRSDKLGERNIFSALKMLLRDQRSQLTKFYNSRHKIRERQLVENQ